MFDHTLGVLLQEEVQTDCERLRTDIRCSTPCDRHVGHRIALPGSADARRNRRT